MRSLLAAALLGALLAAPPAAYAQDAPAEARVVGAWSAEEDYFRATILIERAEGGALAAYFAGDDLVPGAAFSAAAVRGDSVFLAADAVDARFRGAVAADGSAIRGTYTQGEMSVALTLVPAAPPAPPSRPQEPAPPFPYASEEVAFEGGAGARVVGTLTVPDGPGPHPGVVLIQGSGANDRDYSLGGHRPFLVLADHLARHGVATLRYDERGAGASDADPLAATLDDEGQDAAAALLHLQAHPAVDADRVGIVGHSMGGVLAPYVHDRLTRAAFLVLLAPPGADLAEVLLGQGDRMATAAGVPEAQVRADRAAWTAVFDAARAETDSLTAAAQMAAALGGLGFDGGELEARVRAHAAPVFRDLLRYDPAPALARVDVPVLLVYGTNDVGVRPAENAGPVLAALAASPSGDVTVRLLRGLNHWFQPSETGWDDEIAQIETTLDPGLLDELTAWIRTRTAGD